MSSDRNAGAAEQVEAAIRIDGLCKTYRLYDRPEDRLKESLSSRINRMLGRAPVNYCREFKALDDVSLEVRKGETVGIIGKNGSGKSTLLQIVSGTLSPTAGQIDVTGRVAALLELGSGFHPDFTGRENVYMNAALYGMDAREVDRKLDEIALFADIGEYLDQPVKSYSTGMMLRLAFAVIAQVEADILVIDEALAVGDAVFVQKCMRFIKSFQRRGSLLFVSHDLAAVQNLCDRAIWLSQGRVEAAGTAREVTEAYLRSTLQEIYGEEHELKSTDARAGAGPGESAVQYGAVASQVDNLSEARGWKTGVAELLKVALSAPDNGETRVFKGNERVRMTLEAVAHEAMEAPILGFIVRDRLGQDLFGENTLPFTSEHPVRAKKGEVLRAVFEFRLPMLPNGEYVVMASVAEGDLNQNVQHHLLHDALVLTVSSSKVRWGLTGIPFERVSMEVVGG